MAASKVVVMARGLGSRMRRAGAAELTAAQVAAAASGAKAMMPLGGRPFLDHVLTRLADAGLTDVCLVIGPEHEAVRAYYGGLAPERIAVSFAVQAEPRGTADAVAAAEAFVGDEPFVVVNGDNLYPTAAVQALAALPGCGTVGFRPDALVARSNIPADRMAAVALIRTDADGALAAVVEKPEPEVAAALGPNRLVSMNCWRFTPAVFDACRSVVPSPRGELELTDAVRALVAAGVRVDVVPSEEGVWDLSSRGDVAPVAAALAGDEVRL